MMAKKKKRWENVDYALEKKRSPLSRARKRYSSQGELRLEESAKWKRAYKNDHDVSP